MIEIDELAAQSEFDTLLDQVEKGEEITIIRDGRAIARLIPAKEE